MNLPEIEKKILDFWQKNKIFHKSLKQRLKRPRFVFYEGPPTANGRPGIHHVLSRSFKDVMPRYKTMRGFYVERKAGWDTHGLPVELEVEKKLGLKNKQEIENYGLAKFNRQCRESVWRYKDEWERITERIGFWLDLKNPYITYENNYMESLWWVIKQIWDKKLIYQDYKVVPYCCRCGTALSSHETALGYKNIKENSVFVKFKITPAPQEKLLAGAAFLVWTTTPWTLPGNSALALHPRLIYVLIEHQKERLILAKQRLDVLTGPYKIIKEFQGADLLDIDYQPFYNHKKPESRAFFTVEADFVSANEGTGLVHIAPAFGEDDMAVGKKNHLPVLVTVDEQGRMAENEIAAGWPVKQADAVIIEDLKKRGLLYKEELYEHDYPFCWRCGTALLYYPRLSWFIQMSKIKTRVIENNQKINWLPGHIKKGRFGEWLKEMKDWAFSRDRYWGTPLPIWQCLKCQQKICLGSIKELFKKAKNSAKIKTNIDLHRPYIDKIFLDCPDCSGRMERVKEVADCWFDSGAMPWAQWHYPFQNKNKIDKNEAYPADFIAEGIDQTRGWFYTLLAVATLLEYEPPYKNVIALGHVLDAQGQKMSKSKGNAVDPWQIIERFGADTLRWYFYTINAAGDAKKFNPQDIEEKHKKFISTLWHVFVFWTTYTDKSFSSKRNIKLSILDKWIFSKLNNLTARVIEYLEEYNIVAAARLIEDFVIEDLSNWYVRRSRRRFQKPKNQQEKQIASQVLYDILLDLVKLLAPFIPFLSEEIYLHLIGDKKLSVHLADYPQSNKRLISRALETNMERVRKIAAEALALRARAGLKVRQPLSQLIAPGKKLTNELAGLIKGEVNVQKISFGGVKKLKLDTRLTEALKEEGLFREVARQIQMMRKEAGLTHKDKIDLKYKSEDANLIKVLKKRGEYIKKETLAKSWQIYSAEHWVSTLEKSLQVDGREIIIALKK